jgi:dUTP pyrophosphatase
MKICIKNAAPSIHESDTINRLYSHHQHYHAGDSGLDLYMPYKTVVRPGETVIMDMHIKCEASTDSGEPCSYLIYPRSSISKTPLRLANSVGVVDRDYRGNIFVALDNIKDVPYTIEEGDRLVQICAADLSPITMTIVSELSAPGTRGEGGFGSTGR